MHSRTNVVQFLAKVLTSVIVGLVFSRTLNIVFLNWSDRSATDQYLLLGMPALALSYLTYLVLQQPEALTGLGGRLFRQQRMWNYQDYVEFLREHRPVLGLAFFSFDLYQRGIKAQ